MLYRHVKHCHVSLSRCYRDRVTMLPWQYLEATVTVSRCYRASVTIGAWPCHDATVTVSRCYCNNVTIEAWPCHAATVTVSHCYRDSVTMLQWQCHDRSVTLSRCYRDSVTILPWRCHDAIVTHSLCYIYPQQVDKRTTYPKHKDISAFQATQCQRVLVQRAPAKNAFLLYANNLSPLTPSLAICAHHVVKVMLGLPWYQVLPGLSAFDLQDGWYLC